MAVLARAEITLTAITDIRAVYRYYLLQASTLAAPGRPAVNPPPAPWDDTEPVYIEGSTNSLYIVDLTVFSDDTFYYSEVSLSSSYEAAKAAWNLAHNAQQSANAANNGVNEANSNIAGLNDKIDENKSEVDNELNNINSSIGTTQQDIENINNSINDTNTNVQNNSQEIDAIRAQDLARSDFIHFQLEALPNLPVGIYFRSKKPDGSIENRLAIVSDIIQFYDENNVRAAYITNRRMYIDNSAVINMIVRQPNTDNTFTDKFKLSAESNGHFGVRLI